MSSSRLLGDFDAFCLGGLQRLQGGSSFFLSFSFFLTDTSTWDKVKISNIVSLPLYPLGHPWSPNSPPQSTASILMFCAHTFIYMCMS